MTWIHEVTHQNLAFHSGAIFNQWPSIYLMLWNLEDTVPRTGRAVHLISSTASRLGESIKRGSEEEIFLYLWGILAGKIRMEASSNLQGTL